MFCQKSFFIFLLKNLWELKKGLSLYGLITKINKQHEKNNGFNFMS